MENARSSNTPLKNPSPNSPLRTKGRRSQERAFKRCYGALAGH